MSGIVGSAYTAEEVELGDFEDDEMGSAEAGTSALLDKVSQWGQLVNYTVVSQCKAVKLF